MNAKTLMIQGTGSDVGKSVIVAGLCRAAKNRGLSVAPFKPQNMSNNAAACAGGGEIGRAQALQAMACEISPAVDHNPVLLKPETDRVAQVVIHGKVLQSMQAAHFIDSRDSLLPPVLESFERLCKAYDFVLVEGAGSPAETNLRERDIANMGFARAAGVPVCLLGDIERGGVIASIVGTKTVIDAADAQMIIGFAINKFRGDPALFDQGVVDIEKRTRWPCFGVIPWLKSTAKLPAEDAVPELQTCAATEAPLRIVAPMLSRMANFDDADPLRQEPGVSFEFVPPGQALPRDADLIILFGSKSTLGDLAFLREQGWDHDIIAHARQGGRVLGICGGYQMLGKSITDSDGNDGICGAVPGLGLLDVETQMRAEKTVRPVRATCALSGKPASGYEIHVGETSGADCVRPMFHLDGENEGARSASGKITGTYLHGLMTDDEYRRWFIESLGATGSSWRYTDAVDMALDDLAAELELAIDIDRLFAAARPAGWSP
ncbi:MAG: cobyric acid synthase [Pseudomonadota bacterium]